jgi:hypothetical protein
VVLAGDPHQLGPTTMSQAADRSGFGTSLIERLVNHSNCYARDDSGSFDPRYITKLVTSYRCRQEILAVPNELFYNGELAPALSERMLGAYQKYADWSALPRSHFPVWLRGVSGQEAREGSSPSWFNIAEVEVIVDSISRLLADVPHITTKDIAVISPYKKQVEKIRKVFAAMGDVSNLTNGDTAQPFSLRDVQVGSCEHMQGQERRVVIISTVRSSTDHLDFDVKYSIGFLANPKRFNVAVTRAQALLIVVGNPRVLASDKSWSQFLWYCVDSGAYSGCDLPARQSADERAALEFCGDDVVPSLCEENVIEAAVECALACSYPGDNEDDSSSDGADSVKERYSMFASSYVATGSGGGDGSGGRRGQRGELRRQAQPPTRVGSRGGDGEQRHRGPVASRVVTICLDQDDDCNDPFDSTRHRFSASRDRSVDYSDDDDDDADLRRSNKRRRYGRGRGRGKSSGGGSGQEGSRKLNMGY